jgi:DNA polymerase-1
MLLLDGHSLAYRAFFALPDSLRTSTGELTNAVHGFISMLLRLLVERSPVAVAVTFDVGEDEERTAAYEDYKAGRDEMPDELFSQIDRLHEVLPVLGIAVVEVPGVEADDVLATLATAGVADGYRVEIVTGDRDAMQLVDDDITVLYTLKGISEVGTMTPAAVHERFGVAPARYVEFAALRGDGSDNLPGVPGVGPKTAANLLNEFGSIEGIYANIAAIKLVKQIGPVLFSESMLWKRKESFGQAEVALIALFDRPCQLLTKGGARQGAVPDQPMPESCFILVVLFMRKSSKMLRAFLACSR